MALENPALNERSFQGIEEAGAEPRGMSAAGTYAITGLLFVIVVAAAAFGWSQVEIVTVGGRQEALTPAWTWLAFLLTFIVAIVGAFAYRAAPITSVQRLGRGFAAGHSFPLLRPEVRRDRLAGADRHIVHIPGCIPPLQPAHRQSYFTIRNGGYSGDGRFSAALRGGLLLSLSG